jgi:membrane-associated phospholipid phosphatase
LARLGGIQRSRPLAFIRDWYPVALIIFGFEEMNRFVTILFPYWANSFIVNLDKAIFGVHPTVWLERVSSVWLSELMVFFLSAYFLMIPVAGGTLYLQKRKQDFYGLMFNVMLAYYVSFYAFLFFPAEGPWVILTHLQTKPLEGGLLSRLYLALQHAGSIKGGCFPSSHVAGAFAVALSMFKYEKKVFYGLIIVASGVGLGTVYGRYHHAVDSIAGILIAAACVAVGTRISARRLKKHAG